MNILEGKPLRYLIGIDYYGPGKTNEIWEVGYDVTKPVTNGISIAYCNLLDEKNLGEYGPYLPPTDTSKDYNEGHIDPSGAGWDRNLHDQFTRRREQGFVYIELDNPDAYSVTNVIDAVETAKIYNLLVIAKNPLVMDGNPTPYVASPNIYGIIVEIDDSTPAVEMPKLYDNLRKDAGKPTLPVWFTSNQDTGWAHKVARAITASRYRNMSVTVSPRGEYTGYVDILRPI